MTTQQVSVYLPADLIATLEARARESDRSMSYLIRKAVESHYNGESR